MIHFFLPPGILGTTDYRQPDWVTQLKESKAKKKGNKTVSPNVDFIDTLEESLLTDSSFDNTPSPLSEDNLVFDFPTNPCMTLSLSPNSDSFQFISDFNELGCYKMSASFHYLPPIEESSEPSSGSSSKSNQFSTTFLKSSSCHDITNTDLYESLSDCSQGRSQTFPKRSKSNLKSKSYNLTDNRTLYPLEPRELDPSAFYQLHNADSQEELQEFLLLESQCMSTEGGLSAAFTSRDTGNGTCRKTCLQI